MPFFRFIRFTIFETDNSPQLCIRSRALIRIVNGYDEEYLMKDLFEAPGTGVGDAPSKAKEYSKPLRDLLREALSTKALLAVQRFLERQRPAGHHL